MLMFSALQLTFSLICRRMLIRANQVKIAVEAAISRSDISLPVKFEQEMAGINGLLLSQLYREEKRTTRVSVTVGFQK